MVSIWMVSALHMDFHAAISGHLELAMEEHPAALVTIRTQTLLFYLQVLLVTTTSAMENTMVLSGMDKTALHLAACSTPLHGSRSPCLLPPLMPLRSGSVPINNHLMKVFSLEH